MTNYRNQILSAIDNAAPMEKVDDVWQLMIHKDLQDYLNLPDLKMAHDDHPIFLDINPKLIPYVVAAEAASELRLILDQYLKISKEKLPVKERVLEIQHEVEHGQAAEKLGGKPSMYGLEFYKSSDGEDLVWRLVHFPRELHTTKIGLAVLSVYPVEPSEGDIAQIESLGYRDVKEVARLAKEYGLPAPLSTSKMLLS